MKRVFAAVVAALALAIPASGCSSETDAPPAAVVFLDKSMYADLITIDPTFPYEVTQKHAANASIAGSRWGRHGGPMVTTGIFGDAPAPKVLQFKPPADATGEMTSIELPVAAASGLPAKFFYGGDGMVDVPFGPFGLLAYGAPDKPFAGEALLYSSTYDDVVSRAKVNGFFSGVGVEANGLQLLVYSGLSPLAATDSSTNDNGLYAAPICAGALGGSCAAAWKLFGWDGNSGPVVSDARGDVFVGASLTNGPTSDAIYAFTKTQLQAGRPIDKSTIAELSSGGTASLAAIAPDGAKPGWVLGLGFADGAPIYAASFTATGDALTKGTVIERAITRAEGVDAISAFTDSDGDLWLAVVKGSAGTYLELRRKP